jgi:hypothetical protein
VLTIQKELIDLLPSGKLTVRHWQIGFGRLVSIKTI